MRDPFIDMFTKAPQYTGTFYCQEVGEYTDGRKLVAIVSVIAVPSDDTTYTTGKQFGITLSPDTGIARVTIKPLVEHGNRFKGYGLGNILMEPIWSV
jgi:hypothetical protein